MSGSDGEIGLTTDLPADLGTVGAFFSGVRLGTDSECNTTVLRLLIEEMLATRHRQRGPEITLQVLAGFSWSYAQSYSKSDVRFTIRWLKSLPDPPFYSVAGEGCQITPTPSANFDFPDAPILNRPQRQ